MDLEFLMVPGGPPPPPTAAYSHAVRAGDLLFVTGQLGVDPLTGALVEGGVTAQTRQVMANLKAVLAGAGTSLDRAVMVRVYLVNFGDYAEMNAEYASHFAPGRLPARSGASIHDSSKNRRPASASSEENDAYASRTRSRAAVHPNSSSVAATDAIRS